MINTTKTTRVVFFFRKELERNSKHRSASLLFRDKEIKRSREESAYVAGVGDHERGHGEAADRHEDVEQLGAVPQVPVLHHQVNQRVAHLPTRRATTRPRAARVRG
jgi:hypothetical protein